MRDKEDVLILDSSGWFRLAVAYASYRPRPRIRYKRMELICPIKRPETGISV